MYDYSVSMCSCPHKARPGYEERWNEKADNAVSHLPSKEDGELCMGWSVHSDVACNQCVTVYALSHDQVNGY